MTSHTHVDKAAIVAALRAGGWQTRADCFDRELPEFVDAATPHFLEISTSTRRPWQRLHPDAATSEQ